MNRWFFRHKTFFRISWNISGWTLVALLFMLYSPWWLLGGLLVLFLSSMFNQSCRGMEMNEAVKKLNDECDPDPMQKIIEEQIVDKRVRPGGTYMTLLQVNKACTLAVTGQREENLRLLREINIDAKAGILPVVKYTYYNNLASAYMDVDDFRPVEYLLEKSEQLFSCLSAKTKAQKGRLYAYNLTLASYKLYLREFDEAAALADSIDETDACKRLIVAKHMLKAEILIAQEKTDEAIPHLQYVVENGNKLFVVTEAKELLSAINEK
ncbi:MAG: hypothetical protein FWE69_05235 [Clostridiales bacterium]|nr:hypothetical protein [Clostridiales bacterium]